MVPHPGQQHPKGFVRKHVGSAKRDYTVTNDVQGIRRPIIDFASPIWRINVSKTSFNKIRASQNETRVSDDEGQKSRKSPLPSNCMFTL